MLGFGSIGEFALGEVPGIAGTPVHILVTLGLSLGQAGIGVPVESPRATLAITAGAIAAAKSTKIGRSTIGAAPGMTALPRALGNRTHFLSLSAGVSGALTGTEYVYRSILPPFAEGALGQFAIGEIPGSRTLKSGVPFGMTASASAAATTVGPRTAIVGATAGVRGADVGAGHGSATLAMRADLLRSGSIFALRAQTLGLLQGWSALDQAVIVRRVTLAATIGQGLLPAGGNPANTALGLRQGFVDRGQGVGGGAGTFGLTADAHDGAKGIEEPTGAATLAARLGFSGVSRVAAKVSGVIGLMLGQRSAMTQTEAVTASPLVMRAKLAGAETARTHAATALPASVELAGDRDATELVGLALPMRDTIAASSTEAARAAAAFGVAGVANGVAIAIGRASASLAVIGSRIAVREAVTEPARATLAVLQRLAGSMSVSIRARALGVTTQASGTTIGVHAGAVRLAVTAGQAEAPSVIGRRTGTIGLAVGAASAEQGRGASAVIFASLFNVIGQRFFDLRFARKLFGRGSRATFAGRAERPTLHGRGSRSAMTGRET